MPNLSFYGSHEVLPSYSQSLTNTSHQLPPTSLRISRSRSYDSGHHIGNLNIKRHLSQSYNNRKFHDNDAQLITNTSDSANNLENNTPPLDKGATYSHSQELSGLSSSSFQEPCFIAETDNGSTTPLSGGIHPARCKSQPWNIYSLYENTSNSNQDTHGMRMHRSLTQTDNNSFNPLSTSCTTGLDEDGSLPVSFDSQIMRLWSNKSDVDNRSTDNQTPFGSYLILDPLTSGDPLQGVHHDSTPIKVTKIIVNNNQSKPQELTKIGNVNHQNQSNRTENKPKLFTSGSSSDETNLDDIFTPTDTNSPENNQSKFQFETNEVVAQNKDIIPNNNPVSQSSNISTENTISVSTMDNKALFNDNDGLSPILRKESKYSFNL